MVESGSQNGELYGNNSQLAAQEMLGESIESSPITASRESTPHSNATSPPLFPRINRTVSGNESVHSTRSSMIGLPANTKHLEPGTDGLHLSVMESVTAVITENGTPTSINVFGEAAIAYRHDVGEEPPSMNIHISCPATI